MNRLLTALIVLSFLGLAPAAEAVSADKAQTSVRDKRGDAPAAIDVTKATVTLTKKQFVAVLHVRDLPRSPRGQ